MSSGPQAGVVVEDSALLSNPQYEVVVAGTSGRDDCNVIISLMQKSKRKEDLPNIHIGK